LSGATKRMGGGRAADQNGGDGNGGETFGCGRAIHIKNSVRLELRDVIIVGGGEGGKGKNDCSVSIQNSNLTVSGIGVEISDRSRLVVGDSAHLQSTNQIESAIGVKVSRFSTADIEADVSFAWWGGSAITADLGSTVVSTTRRFVEIGRAHFV